MLAAHLVEAGWLLQNLPTVRNFEGSVLGCANQSIVVRFSKGRESICQTLFGIDQSIKNSTEYTEYRSQLHETCLLLHSNAFQTQKFVRVS